MKKEKLAIIMSGGGMKGIYGAGVSYSLIKHHKLTNPDILICGSASTGTGSYFISKQYNLIKDIWLHLGLSKKTVNINRFWRIIDINFLIDDIFKKDFPLDTKKLYNSKTKYFISALNKKSGNIDYFNVIKEKNVFEDMRASMAIPIAFTPNPHVKVNGYYHCDSMASTIAENHIKKAVKLGATKIIIVSSILHKSNSIDRKLFKLWLLFQKCRKKYYQTEKELSNYKPPKNIKILSIYPKTPLNLSTIKNSEDILIKSFDQGFNETKNNKELKKFLKK